MVKHYDEHVVSWLRRLNQQAMRSAALAAGLELADNSVFDAEEMVKISEKIIEKAHAEGNCVIVGRGSQCVLQHRPDVYHVFVYAPVKERILRLKDRLEKGVTSSSGFAPSMASALSTCSSSTVRTGTTHTSTTS